VFFSGPCLDRRPPASVSGIPGMPPGSELPTLGHLRRHEPPHDTGLGVDPAGGRQSLETIEGLSARLRGPSLGSSEHGIRSWFSAAEALLMIPLDYAVSFAFLSLSLSLSPRFRG
jgi:hypothetical protein